jgi:hypothetical protein
MRNTKNGWFPQQPKFMITINKSKLEKQFKQNLSNFKLTRSNNALKYIDFLNNNGIEPSEHLISIG